MAPMPALACSANFPASSVNATIACGSISLSHFAQIFNNGNGTSYVENQFNALSSACEMTNIKQLDINQASFLLGAAAFYTGNLTNTGANVTDQFGFRGAMLMGGQPDYEAYTNFTSKNGLPCDLVANSTLVHDNNVLSWMSALYFMHLANEQGETCMQLVSASEFGSCIAVMDASKCDLSQQFNQLLMLETIQSASVALGSEIPSSTLQMSMCKAPMDDTMVSSSNLERPISVLIAFVMLVSMAL
jgi:hypothetical protein